MHARLTQAITELSGALPELAESDGRIHFKFARRNNTLLIETERGGMFCTWIYRDGELSLFTRTTKESRLKRLRTVGESYHA